MSVLKIQICVLVLMPVFYILMFPTQTSFNSLHKVEWPIRDFNSNMLFLPTYGIKRINRPENCRCAMKRLPRRLLNSFDVVERVVYFISSTSYIIKHIQGANETKVESTLIFAMYHVNLQTALIIPHTQSQLKPE